MRFILSTLLIVFSINPALADSIVKQKVIVKRPYAYATMPGAQTAAAFMVIQNTTQSGSADRLIGASSKVADIVEIHENIIDPDDGKMMMRKVKSLELPVGKEVILKPAGYHIMFINMKQSFTMNKQFPLTLIFEKAGEVDVDVNVVPPGMEPDSSTDLNKNQQATEHPVAEFIKNIFSKKEETLY